MIEKISQNMDQIFFGFFFFVSYFVIYTIIIALFVWAILAVL